MAKSVKPAAKKTATAKKPVKKAIAVKNASSKSETGIKYSDKSAGQPELVPIFNELKKLMLPYGKGSMKLRGGEGGQVGLVSEKPVEIKGKKRDEYWFAGALIQKGYVGFYFMPTNNPSEQKEIFKPELLKCLKGKSCFYIKKADAEIYNQIKQALALGYRKCKEKGLI